MYNNLIHTTVQTICCHLWKNCITSCSHICSTNHQCIESVVIHFNCNWSSITAGNTGTLHRHCNTKSSDFTIAHIFTHTFFIPADHLFCTSQTTVKSTTVCCLSIICRHNLSFSDKVHLTQFDCIHIQLFCQFIHSWFQCKYTLSCTISSICSRRHIVCVYNIICKTESLCFSIQRNRLMSRQSNCCRTMLTISSRIWQCVHINRFDYSVFISSDSYMDLHLMSRWRCNQRFFSCKNHLWRFSSHPCYKCRIHLSYRCLFCSKSASDSRFDNTYLRFWDI